MFRAILIALAILAGASPCLAATPKPGKVYENFTSRGAYKFIDSSKGDCTGCVFDNGLLEVDRMGFQLNRKVSDILIDGVVMTLRRPTKGGDLPAGVQVTATGGAPDRITIQNSEASGFSMVPDGGYPQGEFLDCDSRTTHITLRNNYAHDNGDGGFDTKCITEAFDLRSERNYRNYRIWGQFTATTLTSADPRNAHVWVSKGANATIDLLEAGGSSGAAVFYYGDGATSDVLTVKKCVFDFSVPTRVFKGAVSKSEFLDASCLPDAQGYAVNTAKEPPPPAPDLVLSESLPDGDGDGRIALSSKTSDRLKLPRGTVLIPFGPVEGGFGYMLAK